MRTHCIGLYACAVGALILTQLGVGCDFAEELTQMRAPEVVSFSPDSRVAGLDTTGGLEAIAIEFSARMDRPSTERAFSLTRDGKIVGGRFGWSGKRMQFIPDGGLSSAALYRYELGTDAQDRYGNALVTPFRFEFRTGDSEGAPSIVSHSPLDGGTRVDPRAPIELRFSEALERESLLQAFELTPAVAGSFSWAERDSFVRFTPAENYRANSEYRVRLTTALRSRSGVANPDERSFTFHTGPRSDLALTKVRVTDLDETLLPTDAREITYGIETDDRLTLRFNRAVTLEERRDLITVTPRVSHSLRWSADAREAELEFSNDLRRYELYQLTALADEYRFVVDGPRTLKPRVSEIWFNPDPDADSGAEGSGFIRLHLNDLITLTETENAVLRVIIAHAVGAEVELGRFLEAFRVVSSEPSVGFELLNVLSVDHEPGSDAVLSDYPHERTSIRLRASTDPHPVSGTLRLELAAGFKDSFGNRIDEPFNLSLNY